MLQSLIDFFDYSGGNALPMVIGGTVAVVCLLAVWLVLLFSRKE